MERIHKLPYILGCLAALVVGIVNYSSGAGNQTIFLRMAVVMTIFFIIGVFIRNTILSIQDEVEEKEKERIREEEQQARQEHEKQKAAAEAAKHQQPHKNQTGHMVNLVAEDTGEEFEPLTVSRIISSQVKE